MHDEDYQTCVNRIGSYWGIICKSAFSHKEQSYRMVSLAACCFLSMAINAGEQKNKMLVVIHMVVVRSISFTEYFRLPCCLKKCCGHP